MNSIEEEMKQLSKYFDVTVDKEFASEIMPIVELVITDGHLIEKISRSELPFFQSLYINQCDRNGIRNKMYDEIIKSTKDNVCRNLLNVLSALKDIVEEDTKEWKEKWKIKEYNKIKYNKVRSDLLNIEAYVLEPKPEYVEKDKENEKIRKYNQERRKKCEKWRNSNLKFYKKLLRHFMN